MMFNANVITFLMIPMNKFTSLLWMIKIWIKSKPNTKAKFGKFYILFL